MRIFIWDKAFEINIDADFDNGNFTHHNWNR